MNSMGHFLRRAGAFAALATVLGCSSGESESKLGTVDPPVSRIGQRVVAQVQQAVSPSGATVYFKDACPSAGPDEMRCHAKVITDESGEPIVNATAPQAGWLNPTNLRAAYGLKTSGGNGRLVAIVDGFHAPNAERDMNVYRQYYGIPPCTSASGCFKQVNTDGNTPDPMAASDPGWVTEIMLDLDMVSATCPDCKILLVEAKSGLAIDLGPAVQRAAAMGAFAINNSYGEPEDDATMARLVEQDYNQPGVLVVASSGDDGYGQSTTDDGKVIMQNANPANLPWVLSVGGTTLRQAAGGRGWTESVWGRAGGSGAGSGCSSHMPKPSWQKDTACARRMIADVAAVADPATGVAYYNGGWFPVGGTSASSPIVAGIFSLYGIWSNSWPYENPTAFFDVTSGVNGICTTPYLCTGVAGYDGPTGLGTPNGAMFPATPPPPPPPPMDGGTKNDAGNPTTGAGGAAGAGGGGPGAGGATTGGAGAGGSPSGSGGAGGSNNTTGSTTGSAGASTTTTSTTGGSAGSMGAGGSSNPFAPKADASSGCGCRVGAETPRHLFGAHALMLAFALRMFTGRRKGEKGSKSKILPVSPPPC